MPRGLLLIAKKVPRQNDWILANTKDKKTYAKIANMIIEYSTFFEKEARKNMDTRFFTMDEDFYGRLNDVVKYLV